jgi:hypothetical protein
MTRVRIREHVGPMFPVRDQETTKKRLIATFAGEHFVAEREGGELRIYAVGTGELGAVVLDSAGQSERDGLRRWQEMNDRAYAKTPPAESR